MVLVSPVVINVLGYKINSVDNGAIANMGSLQSIDKLISYKRNQGFGELIGDLSPVNLPANVIIDPDVSDSNAIKNSVI
ncbi:spore germination protein [Niallia circulans]|uniref:spore germination protein n=1 Tax=Niallia circulans TaxID=1397 RepID=UPI0026EF68B6|nr:spore germination protein [Niallia circulans]